MAARASSVFLPSVVSRQFDQDVSLMIMGLPYEDNEDLMTIVKNVRAEPVAVERIRTRGGKPGLVKVELRSVEESLAELRRKLKDNGS